MERVLAVHKNPIIDESIIQLMLKDTSDTEESISTFLGTAESEQIRQILTDCRGNRNEAAKRLGISRSTLWRKLKRQQANCT